jgi:hypothetical protein
MMRNIKRLKRSKDGSMPFVVIGVVLLIIGSAYAVMVTQAKDIEENADNMITELDSLDSAITETKTAVERGLGELIFKISTDPEGGSLEKREGTFNEHSSKWVKSNYPRTDRGVSVTIMDFKFVLEAEPLKLVTSDTFADGYTPSYLRATGYITAKFICATGTSVRTISISTDGTCALPLVAEKGSLFDLMVSGEGSALSQMMTHQLTALAQYRVLNGYGALAEYGSMGTMSIITTDDVMSSYNSSLKMLELLVFRCPSEGFPADLERIDLADILASKDGYVEIDLSAVYSQALISIIDDLVLKWFDYLYGNLVVDLADRITDGIRNAWDSLKGFFSGKNEFSAAPYIEQVMRDNGLDVGLYTRLYSGKSTSIKLPGFDLMIDGKNVSISSLSITSAYPNVDLMGWGGITKFKSNYRGETNEIREWLRNTINTAAVNIGSTKALGTVRVPIDPTDNESFMETVKRTVDKALDKGNTEVERIMTSAIMEQKISDPFYAAIYKVITDDRDKIYGIATFKENIRSSISSALVSYFRSNWIEYTANDLEQAVDVLIHADSVKKAMTDYEGAVNSCLTGLKALQEVPGGNPSFIKTTSTAIFMVGVLFVDITTNVPERIRMLCTEAVENTNINPYSGPLDLPGTDSFKFVGAGGNTTVEKITFSTKSAPKVSVKGPNDNLKDCIHYVGFSENTGASYSTAFSVKVEDTLQYTLKSSGIIEETMGIYDSVYKGYSDVSMELKIVVGSGWGLAGVKNYTPSNHLLQDVWNGLLKILSPLLEPLRKVMSIIMDTISIMGSTLIEFAKYVASVVERLFNTLMSALEALAKFIEDSLNKLFSSILGLVVESVQKVVGSDPSKQAVSISYMGFTISIKIGSQDPVDNVKTLLTVSMGLTMGSLSVSGSVTIKQKDSGSGKELMLFGSAEVKGKMWYIAADIDPLMKCSNQILVIDGVVMGTSFYVVLPELVQYQHISFSLGGLPVIGALISNIPLPIPGLKASFDVGIDLKFNIPYDTGILINEFELNPPATDRGNEWIEIYNATKEEVDLTGYIVRAGSNPEKKSYTITDLTLSPWGRAVVYLPGSFLNNNGSALIPEGECVILYSPDGKEVDRTPIKKDTKNNDFTWQRMSDGAKEWVFAKGTPGQINCGGTYGGHQAKVYVLNLLKDTAISVFNDMKTMKTIEDVDDLTEYFEEVVLRSVNEGIELFASCIIEAGIFVSLDITDYTSTVCAGVRLSLFVDSDFVEVGLKYLAREMGSFLLNIENPYGIRSLGVMFEHLYLGVTLYVGLTCPYFLKNLHLYPTPKIGIHFDTNLAGMARLVSSDLGKYKITAGVLVTDCPTILLPPSWNVDRTLESDLWLLKAEFSSAR